MHVEVNEQNIVLYGLVQLTGNTAEDLLQNAEEAKKNGYVLSCDVPLADDLVESNVFEAAESEVSDEVDESRSHIIYGDDVVSGEVVDRDDD